MKRILTITLVLIFAIMMVACGSSTGEVEQSAESSESVAESQEATTEMKLLIGEQEVQVQWENNDAVNALKDQVNDAPLTIDMSMYSDFEQVGELGMDLPANDKQIETEAGDIMLYSGDKIVVFYGTNSWAYTPLGKIQNKTSDELTELLGNGDVSITLK